MKISFSTLAFPELEFEKIVERAKEYGYDGIEIRGILNELDLSKVKELNQDAEKTKKFLSKYGIEISCISSSCVFSSPIKEKREENVNLAISHIKIAKEFNSNLIRIFIGRIPEGINYQECIGYVIDPIKKVVEYGEKYGVKVGIETHDDFSKGENLIPIFESINSQMLGCVWDVHNSVAAGEKVDETFSFIKDKIFILHIKDGDLKGNFTLLGEGKLPLEDIFNLLKKSKYNGWLSVEWEKRWKKDLLPSEVALPQYVKTLREYLKN